MVAVEAAENHGDDSGVTWYLRWGIYTSISTWTHPRNSVAAEKVPSLKTFSHGTSLKWSWISSQSSWE